MPKSSLEDLPLRYSFTHCKDNIIVERESMYVNVTILLKAVKDCNLMITMDFLCTCVYGLGCSHPAGMEPWSGHGEKAGGLIFPQPSCF